jgi:hypothetical protein
MFAEEASDDVMVMNAIQYLDGFDMTNDPKTGRLLRHGLPGEYVRFISEVADELERWRARCVDYDADPEGWSLRAQEAARRHVEGKGPRLSETWRDPPFEDVWLETYRRLETLYPDEVP